MTFGLAFVVFAVVVAAMAVGVLLGGRRLRGSCGRTGEECACTWIERRTCALRRGGATGNGR